MKSFIYLDRFKMYSLSSQLMEGVTDYILEETRGSAVDETTQKGPVASGRIIAEIIEVKNRKKRTYGYSKEIMRALTAQEPYPEKKIMATIITRHGSAPQGLGTKMLIYRDGRCVGTIGGGCMEARVIQIARLMAAGEGEQARICHVDMTGNEAEEEGMVCGGEVDVFLEIV